MVQELSAVIPTIEQYQQQLQQLVSQHPDRNIFLSDPGVGLTTAARLLAFFGDNRELYRDASELQALAGTCPVTEKSGNYKSVYYRTGCNKFFRDVMGDLAFASLRRARWTMASYQYHRKQGTTHQHALRCLANIHLRVLFAMWKNRTQYDKNIFLVSYNSFNNSTRKSHTLPIAGILIFSSGEWGFFKSGPIEIISIPGFLSPIIPHSNPA